MIATDRRDAERFRFLVRNCDNNGLHKDCETNEWYFAFYEGNGMFRHKTCEFRRCRTPRQAIDAAMRAKRRESNGH